MLIIIALVVVFLIFIILLYNAFASQKWHRKHQGKEKITENEHFYFYLFYFNPKDDRLFVPKWTGGGMTINFAKPLALIIFTLTIGGGLFIVIYELVN